MAERTGETAFFAAVGQETKEAVAAHLATTRADPRFQRQILLVLAVLDGTAARDPIEAVDYRLAQDAASDAAAVCRTQPASASIFAVVDRLEEVVSVCARALGVRRDEGRQRFLFADADLEVAYRHGVWQVRGGGTQAESRLLESALQPLLPALRKGRVGELAEQIHAWFRRGSLG